MTIGTIQKFKLAWAVYGLYRQWEELGMKEFFASKKVKMTIIGLLTTVLVNVIGLPESQANTITESVMIIIGLYVGGQAVADGVSKGATSSGSQK